MPDAAPEAGNPTNANYPVVVVYQDLSENFDIMHDVSSDAWTWQNATTSFILLITITWIGSCEAVFSCTAAYSAGASLSDCSSTAVKSYYSVRWIDKSKWPTLLRFRIIQVWFHLSSGDSMIDKGSSKDYTCKRL